MASGIGMDGYFTGADYPGQLVPQMTAAHIVAAAAWQGIRGPDLSRPFRMLDIGCGRGCALVLAAASHPAGAFEGIDGMESHIAFGRDLASDVPNISFRHATFEEALEGARPDCDLIVVHGVLTWAGPSARYQAMDLAARRLKPGGLLATSYNALPGRARHLAFRHLLCAFANDFPGPPGRRYEAALARVGEMAGARFDAVSREMLRSLAELSKEAPAEYFLHEFMHGDWTPFWASDVKAAFADRGLEFAGTLDFLRMRPDLCLTYPQAQFARGVGAHHTDMMLDMGMDVVFRSDLFAHAPRRRSARALRRGIWLGAEAEPGSKLQVDTPTGTAEIDVAAADDLLAMLEDGPRPMGDILARSGHAEEALTELIECLLIGQHLVPLGPPADHDGLAPARRLNRRLCDAAQGGGSAPIAALAGAHGPVGAADVQMGVVLLEAGEMLDRATADPAFRRRFLHAGADPQAARVRAAVARGLREVRERIARLGGTIA